MNDEVKKRVGEIAYQSTYGCGSIEWDGGNQQVLEDHLCRHLDHDKTWNHYLEKIREVLNSQYADIYEHSGENDKYVVYDHKSKWLVIFHDKGDNNCYVETAFEPDNNSDYLKENKYVNRGDLSEWYQKAVESDPRNKY